MNWKGLCVGLVVSVLAFTRAIYVQIFRGGPHSHPNGFC